MSRQSLQTLSCLNVPDSNTLIKLQKQETGRLETSGTSEVWHSSSDAAYRSRHHQVGLGVEVTAEDIVTVTLQSLQTLPLQKQINIWHQSVATSENRVLSSPADSNQQHLTELLSQIFSVLSSDAETSRLESDDQETSEIP